MSRRFVFVPIFGDINNGAYSSDQWVKAPHVKAWGFYTEKDGQFTPIHTEPECVAIEMYMPTSLFDSEIKAMCDVPNDSTDLPDEVCITLAKLALLPQPVSRSN